MAAVNRAPELIRRYLDEIASPAELLQLERLLLDDPRAAEAFADSARLEALLDHRYRAAGAASAAAPWGASTEGLGSEDAGLSIVGPRAAEAPAINTPSVPIAAGNSSPAGSRRARRLFSWKWPVAVAALLVLAVGAALLSRFGKEGAPTTIISGRVRIDGVEATRIPDGAPMEVTDDAAAQIQLADGSRVELAPTSRAVFHGIHGEVRQTVELVQGGGQFQVAHGGRFRVETPVATVTALGTEFSVRLRPMTGKGGGDNQAATVAVKSGAVEVECHGRRSVLSAGEGRVFRSDGGENDVDDGDRDNKDDGDQNK